MPATPSSFTGVICAVTVAPAKPFTSIFPVDPVSHKSAPLSSLSFSFYFLISLYILHNIQELLTTGWLFPICFQGTLPFAKLRAQLIEMPQSNQTCNNIEAFYHGDEDNSAMAQTDLFNTRPSLPAWKSPFWQCVEGRGMGWAAVSESRASLKCPQWAPAEVTGSRERSALLHCGSPAGLRAERPKQAFDPLCINKICARKRRKEPTHTLQIYQVSFQK